MGNFLALLQHQKINFNRYQAIITHTTSFSNVPNKNPANEPHAAFSAWLELLLAMISPMNAPTNGPMIIPKGPNQKPAIKPMVHPQIPYLLPPNRFVPYNGMT